MPLHLPRRQSSTSATGGRTFRSPSARALPDSLALLRAQARTAEGPVATELLAKARTHAQRARLLIEKGPADADLARFDQIGHFDGERNMHIIGDDAQACPADAALGAALREGRGLHVYREGLMLGAEA